MHQTAQILASGLGQVDPLLIGLLCLLLGAAFGLILSCAALVAIALQCLEQESSAGRIVRSAVLAAALTGTGSAQLAAQEIDADRIPALEPELSKLYGSETLDFGSLFVSGAISPDGRWLAYSRAEVEGSDDGRMNLWIVSLEGGGEATRLTTGKHWEADPIWFPRGDRIAFRSTRPDTGDNFQYLMTIRINTETGRPVGPPRQISLEPGPFNRAHAVSPDGRWLAYVRRPKDASRVGYVLTVVPESGGTARVLVEQQDLAAPLNVLPIDGGPARQLTETRAYEWPMGWTPDGNSVVFESQLDGRKVILVAPLDGSAMRQLARPDEDWVYGPVLSLDHRYVLYGLTEDESGTTVLRVMNTESGRSRLLTRTPWTKFTYYHDSRVDDRFVYAERKEGRFDFRAVHPEGESVLLRSFPDSVFPPIVGVRGDRLAYWEASEGESTLYLATAGQDDAQRVVTFPGRVGQRGSNPPVWSPNGKYLAIGYWRSETNELDALLVELSPTGELVAEPRVIEDLPSSWWSLEWLPTSDGFLIVDGDVWLVPVDPDSPAVKLTDEESWPTWTYALSPDGRYIAISPEVRRGGAFWRLDFGAAIAEAKQR